MTIVLHSNFPNSIIFRIVEMEKEENKVVGKVEREEESYESGEESEYEWTEESESEEEGQTYEVRNSLVTSIECFRQNGLRNRGCCELDLPLMRHFGVLGSHRNPQKCQIKLAAASFLSPFC